MAYTASNLTAAGNAAALQLASADTTVRVTLTGTYVGATAVCEASNDGTTYVPVTGIREDTGAFLAGGSNGFTVGAATFSILLNVAGWSYCRFKLLGITSGTVACRVEAKKNLELPGGSAGVSVSSVATAITSSSANAFAVGPAGATNPAFNVDASASSAATGLNVAAAAAASGLALTVLSSGTNENLTVNAKGSGTISIASVSTGAIALGAATTVAGTLTGTTTSANGLTVGRQGATDPVLQVDASTSSVATGIKIKGAAAAGGCAVSVITSGTNEALTIDAAGSGTITLAGTSTGGITLTTAVTAASSVLSTSATAGVGYGTGAGGTATQSTSKSTGVTLNKVTGTITLNNASLASATSVGFTLTNSAIAATDVVAVAIKSGATADSYTVTVDATAAGSCRISLRNVSGGSLGEAVVLSFAVVKGVAS